MESQHILDELRCLATMSWTVYSSIKRVIATNDSSKLKETLELKNELEQRRLLLLEILKPKEEMPCGICLLEKNDHRSLYVMGCCGTQVHLECISKCIQSRAIENRCSVCRDNLTEEVLEEVKNCWKIEEKLLKDYRRRLAETIEDLNH